MTAVTAVVFVGLVAVGVEYVVHADTNQAAFTDREPQRTASPTGSPSATPTAVRTAPDLVGDRP